VTGSNEERPFLVLSSQRAFEAFTGPVPAALRSRHVFIQPDRAAEIETLLPRARLVISKSYPRPEVNRWIFEARRNHVPTLLLVDGPLEWSNVYANPSLRQKGAEAVCGLFQPVIHDAVATIGPAQSHFIESRNAGRNLETFSYANQRIRTNMNRNTHPTYDFLVTTARTAAFSERERADLSRALCACTSALAAAGHRTLVRIFEDDLRRAVQDRAPGATFETDGTFTQALAQACCVIGAPSSVLLEAMHHDRPTATLVFRDSPLFYTTGWLLGGFADWNESFASMLGRDPERMAHQRQSLQENLSDADFFVQTEPIAHGEALLEPRPFDAVDLDFENRVLRRMAGRRGRFFASIYRLIH